MPTLLFFVYKDDRQNPCITYLEKGIKKDHWFSGSVVEAYTHPKH